MTDVFAKIDALAVELLAKQLLCDMCEPIRDSGLPPGDIAYAMWSILTHMLFAWGWTAEDLTEEVQRHGSEGPGAA